MMAYEIVTTMIMGALCMMAWSIMYRETFWYRIAEDLTIGVMGGYVMATITTNTINNYITPLMKGEIINIIPIILGVLMWTQLSSDYRWMARTPLALITGIGAAIAMKGAVYGNILAPIGAIATPPAGDTMVFINHTIAAIATITSVMYFFFTIKSTGALGGVNYIGRLLMMVGFGSIAGSSVLSNATFLYDRAQWFINTEYAWIPLVIAVVMVGIDIMRRRSS